MKGFLTGIGLLFMVAACGGDEPADPGATGQPGAGGAGGGAGGVGGAGGAAVEVRGTAVVADIGGRMVVTPGDPPADVRLLAPLVGFGPLGAHDYNDVNGFGVGCAGDFFDTAAGDVPAPSVDAGKVTISGYAAGTPIGGTMDVAGTIECGLSSGSYACGFGPFVDGMPGTVNPQLIPFPDTHVFLAPGTVVRIQGEGGPGFGVFDTGDVLKAADTIDFPVDLSTITYDPTADMIFNYTCPGGDCGVTAVAVFLQTSEQPPETFGHEPSSRYGTILCLRLATGDFTVSQGAIAAAFGCDAQGAGCNTSSKSVRTLVVRLSLPENLQDDRMNRVRALAGRGMFGVAPLP